MEHEDLGAARPWPFHARTRLCGLLGWCLASLIALAILQAATLAEPPDDPALDSSMLLLGFQLPALLWIRRELSRSRTRAREYVGPFPARRRVGIWTLLVLCLMGLAIADVILAGEAVRAWDPELFSTWYEDEAMPASPYGTPQRWLAVLPILLVLVVGAPVVEELVFRGVLVDVLGARHGRAFAWICSATIFGLLHAPNVLNAILFGLVMSALRVTSGGLLLPIALHAANNVLPGLLVLLELGGDGQVSASDGAGGASVVLGLVLLALCLPLPLRVIATGWRRAAAEDAARASAPGEQ